jgi:hypothetical protein
MSAFELMQYPLPPSRRFPRLHLSSLRDRRDIADMANHPFPVSFGPASVAPVLGIRRRLRQLAGDPGGLDAVFAHAVSAATTAAEARAAFTDKLNAHSAGQADVATLVAAWLQTSTNRAEAVPFIVETLRRGIPVFGQQSGSRVVTARAGKKWIKANGRLRGMFTSVDVFSAVMEAVLFEFFPRVQELLGDGATPRDVCKAAKVTPQPFALGLGLGRTRAATLAQLPLCIRLASPPGPRCSNPGPAWRGAGVSSAFWYLQSRFAS